MWELTRRMRTAVGMVALVAASVLVAPGAWRRAAGFAAGLLTRHWDVLLLVAVGGGLLGSTWRPRAEGHRRRPVAARLTLLPHVTLLLVLAVALAVSAGFVLWHALGRPDLHGPGPTTAQPGGWTAQSTFEGMKIVLAVVAGLGGVVALTVAYRRQGIGEAAEQREDTRLFTDRFTRAAELLGSDRAAVRLAAVYAVGALADDWRDGRQTCIDVLCAYLRMPCVPPDAGPGPAPDTDTRGAGDADSDTDTDAAGPQKPDPDEERQVRHTVLRLIRDHLRLPHDDPRTWRGHDFDFTGAVFDGGDLSHIAISPGTLLRFAGARFTGGAFTLARSTATGTNVDFSGATVAGATVDLTGVELINASIDLSDASLTAGAVDLGGARLHNASIDFSGATFSGGDVILRRAKLADSYVSFGGARMTGGRLDFVAAALTGGAVNFMNAHLADGMINFTTALFSRGNLDFGGARLSGAHVDFSRATLGGTIDLSSCADRTVPPVFDAWPAKPPAGLRL